MKLQTILAAVLSVVLAAPALAFDLPPPVDAPEITTFSSASGWYMRGDLGYNAAVNYGDPEVRSYNKSTGSYSSTRFDSSRFDSDFTVNAAGGYQFNDWLRSDFSIDYFKGTFKGKSMSSSPCSAIQPAATKCGSSYEQEMASLGLLANAYVDLGTYFGLTPYVGGGAGATNVDYGKMTTSRYCASGGASCDKFTDYKDRNNDGAESWRFTYALMTGVSYDVTSNMKLDLGYRFSQVQGGAMYDWSSSESKQGARGNKGEDDGFARHEFRAGLRVVGW